ncbi:hypothetical protein [Roseicella sp. DB1501]|nr:hypothetical protein [Roseicella sp. DB1501]NOG69569.1 hypothetical protein [Roseicella sp. DB1501]
MPEMELTEVLAWALIAAGLAFGAMARLGLPAASVTAGLAALAMKTAFLG